MRLEDTISLDWLDASAAIKDIAQDGCGGLWLLIDRGADPDWITHVDIHGNKIDEINVTKCPPKNQQIVMLSRGKDLALLSLDGRSLSIYQTQERNLRQTLDLSSIALAFKANRIASDGSDRLFLAGSLEGTKPTQHLVVVLDQSDNTFNVIFESRFSDVNDITGIAGDRSSLWLSTDQSLLHVDFRGSSSEQARSAGESVGYYLSPALVSPENGITRGWLRAEFVANLPRGTTLAVRFASTSDRRIYDEISSIASSTSIVSSAKHDRIRQRLDDLWREKAFIFEGRDSVIAEGQPQLSSTQTLAVPLFATNDPWLWLDLTLTAAPGSAMPSIGELRVLYPEQSLMAHLPEIFRSSAGDTGGFLRRLVGVVETTTQTLDDKIAALGRNINPATAPAIWLDFLASWLELPWDEALPEDSKRRILHNAGELLSKRGTRTGLQLLLECLFPNSRIVLTDMAADFEPARLGNATASGSKLPSVLAGWPRGTTVLADKLVLGHARLACPDTKPDPLMTISRRVDISLQTTTQARTDVEALLPNLLGNAVPAGVQFRIRWRDTGVTGNRMILDDDFMLESRGPRRLNLDSELGQTTLAGKPLDKLTEIGLFTGFKLQ
jgi:phage tail-like protein